MDEVVGTIKPREVPPRICLRRWLLRRAGRWTKGEEASKPCEMSTQAETNRTRYQSTIRLTARELGAVKRNLSGVDYVHGDYALREGVLRRVLDNSRKMKDK